MPRPKNTFRRLAHLVWNRVARWLRTLHRWTWAQFCRRFTTVWSPLQQTRMTGTPLWRARCLETGPRVRRAAWGSGPGVIPTPRPGADSPVQAVLDAQWPWTQAARGSSVVRRGGRSSNSDQVDDFHALLAAPGDGAADRRDLCRPGEVDPGRCGDDLDGAGHPPAVLMDVRGW